MWNGQAITTNEVPIFPLNQGSFLAKILMSRHLKSLSSSKAFKVNTKPKVNSIERQKHGDIRIRPGSGEEQTRRKHCMDHKWINNFLTFTRKPMKLNKRLDFAIDIFSGVGLYCYQKTTEFLSLSGAIHDCDWTGFSLIFKEKKSFQIKFFKYF